MYILKDIMEWNIIYGQLMFKNYMYRLETNVLCHHAILRGNSTRSNDILLRIVMHYAMNSSFVRL